MTNEELCTLIKGGDTGYLPTLWEQTRKFITMQAKQFYNKFDNHMGATVEDLVQSGYFAVLSAVDYYEPEKGLKYITFLSQTLKSAFAETMGIRTSKQDMLDYARSLDEPVNEQEDITLLDKIGDLTPGQGDISINVIKERFLNSERKSAKQISRANYTHIRTVFNDTNDGIRDLMPLIFGLSGIDCSECDLPY